MTINSLLYTARDALQAQTFGVTVTGQNINNANTPGYVRREAVLATRVLGNQSYGSVAIEGIRRSPDAFLERALLGSTGMTARAATRDQELAQVESLFNDFAGSGLGGTLDRLASSFEQLSVDPSDTTARQQVVAALGEFVDRARATGDAIASQRSEIFNQMQGLTTSVNQKAESLAQLNQQIKMATAQGQDASDLKDRRNQVLNELAPIVDVKTVEDADGSMLIQVAGATLVEGNVARKLSVDLDGSGNVRLLAARPEGGTPTDITRGLSGGALAGLLEVRDADLGSVMGRLDTFVFDVATALNTQHRAGFGLDGSTGVDLFDLSSVGAPPAGAARGIRLNAVVASNPNALAASDSAAAVPGSGQNARLLNSVFGNPVVFGASRSVSEAYGDIVGEVGNLRADASREVELRSTMQAQAYSMRESAMGVSLDEEMVNLTRYQRAYQAASRVLTTADEMLQELLGMKR